MLNREEMRLIRENINIERQKQDQIRNEISQTEQGMGEVVGEVLE